MTAQSFTAAARISPGFEYQPEPENWRNHAACRGAVTCPGDDYWHPEGWGTEAQEGHAKRICGGCAVREICLAYALRVDAVTVGRSQGVFGGLNGGERDKLRKGPRK